jgi:predicted DNA-binding transcriptional regulator AlpA
MHEGGGFERQRGVSVFPKQACLGSRQAAFEKAEIARVKPKVPKLVKSVF